MDDQMKMFEGGGLYQEGGTTDPVSGNEVPRGSLQEEVRDDIDAKLSEGEFVFPADVVRYIGLENLMKLRQKAKEGLSKMDDMGQMGNSEAAVVDDDEEYNAVALATAMGEHAAGIANASSGAAPSATTNGRKGAMMDPSIIIFGGTPSRCASKDSPS